MHDNLAILTSVVMGLKLLLRPFQWCYILAPILPSNLVESFEAPMPILAGMTRKDYDSIASEYESPDYFDGILDGNNDFEEAD